MAEQRNVGVALLGCGVVGGGVARILHDQRDLIRQRTGLTFDLRHVVVRNPDKARHPAVPANIVHTDPQKALDDPAVDVVIELIGGTGSAGELIAAAIKRGKSVVTANKSLLAERGAILFGQAREHQTCIGFEASVGGGIPIISALTQGLIGNRIDALVGIVNGTCNFILTKMTQQGALYSDALAEAQAAGFAEADPTLDVSGRDAAQKLALLGSLAFNVRLSEGDIHVEGIDTLQALDIRLAGELGYVVKLLAIALRVDGKLSLRVHPTLVHKKDVLAEVGGSFNAISVYGSAVGHSLFYGRGAGQMPTASAVVADLVSVGLGLTRKAFEQLRIFPDTTGPAPLLPFDELNSRYYLRVLARDEPGVLAQITQILGKTGISLSAVVQHEPDDDKYVPVVIVTHMAREGAMQQALREIDQLATISAPTTCIRIIDQPTEFADNNG